MRKRGIDRGSNPRGMPPAVGFGYIRDHDIMTAWLSRDLPGADAAIRLVPVGEEADLILKRSSLATVPAGAERVMDEVLTPLARPGLVPSGAGLGVLETPPLLEDSRSGLSWADWLSARGGYGLEAQARLKVSESLAALALAEQGAGIVLGRKPLAYDAIRAGRLAPVFAVARICIGISSKFPVAASNASVNMERSRRVIVLSDQSVPQAPSVISV
mgnify:FL=1